MTGPAFPAPVTFGEAVWDPSRRRLNVRGSAVALPHKALVCLEKLIAAAGEPVSREELIQAAWGGAVVEDSSLSHSILSLRKALDPGPDGSSYIETVPRIGYRLAVAIVAGDPPTHDGASAGEVVPAAGTLQTRRARRWRVAAATLAAVGVVSVGAWAARARFERAEAREQTDAMVREGLRLLRRNNAADGTEATAVFEKVLTSDPGSAFAKAAMAEASARMGNESFGRAIDLARAAVAADPTCVECRVILGWVIMTREWKWEESGRLLADAVAGSATPFAHQAYSHWLAIHGRLPEARVQAERAVQLEPANAASLAQLQLVAYLEGRYHEAVTVGHQAAQLNPNIHNAHYWRHRALILLGDDREAASARADSVAGWGAFSPEAQHKLSDDYVTRVVKSGAAGLADFLLAEVSTGRAREVNLYDRAVWQLWAGRPEDALSELEAGIEARPFLMIYTGVDPAFAPLRSHPRFRMVLEKLGLPG